MTWTKKLHPLALCATLIWIALIFSYSLEPATVSSQQSNEIAVVVYESIEILPLQHSVSFDLVAWGVRKAAHFVNFFVLMWCVVMTLRRALPKYGLPSLAVCLVVAIADESIQVIVPGRGALVSDVLINTMGASVALLLVLGLRARHRLRHEN